MFSGSRAACLLACFTVSITASAADLRVCADPNNLPYSNERGEGFENELARLAARDLGRTLRFVWDPQHGRYLKRTLFAGRCDVVMGVPAAFDRVATTSPYYRSSYVFVWRRERGPQVRSFDDHALRTARIGVHLMQNDHDIAPPAQALIARGLAHNIAWYKLYPDFTRPNPPSELIEAVERGDIDVAVAWGPMAGFFAERAPVSLGLNPVAPQTEGPAAFAFDISMGVRPGDTRLLSELNEFINRRRAEIRRVLQKYGVPLTSRVEPNRK